MTVTESSESWPLFEPFGPVYPALAVAQKWRTKAQHGLFQLSLEERREYGATVLKAINSLNRSALNRLIAPYPTNCASGTLHTTGHAICKALREQARKQFWAQIESERKVRANSEEIRTDYINIMRLNGQQWMDPRGWDCFVAPAPETHTAATGETVSQNQTTESERKDASMIKQIQTKNLMSVLAVAALLAFSLVTAVADEIDLTPGRFYEPGPSPGLVVIWAQECDTRGYRCSPVWGHEWIDQMANTNARWAQNAARECLAVLVGLRAASPLGNVTFTCAIKWGPWSLREFGG